MSTRRSFAAALAVALALTAMGAPVAFGDSPSRTLPRPAPAAQDSARDGTTIVRVGDRGGFHWADAGIGAAAGVAVSVLAVALTLLVREHRADRWSHLSSTVKE
jgi:uncharacterized membrane protein